MEPFKLIPAYKDYLWGGSRLRDEYHKETGLFPLAESWELSCHPDGPSVVGSGPCAGTSFPELLSRRGESLCGARCARLPFFPVLIKLIDAKEPLSIQVHPSDEYALRVEGEYGKTEMWVIVDCDPGAFLYFGVNRPVSKEEFRQRIENNTVLEVLNKVEVHPGDVFFIQSGTIHAIGAGILICEIQQNSNCTYRVYDYDRRGADGKPRPLHIDKALDVCTLEPSDTASHLGPVLSCAGGTAQKLGECAYFSTQKLRVEEALTLEAGEESFLSLVCVEGGGLLCGPENILEFTAGESLLVPAGTGKVSLRGDCTVIQTTVPGQA